MQISSTTPPAKRVRVKAKDHAAAPAPKKPRSRKQSAVPATDVDVVAMQPGTDALAGLIATTAYFIAAQRNFAPGQELDDWLEAERRVRSGLAG